MFISSALETNKLIGIDKKAVYSLHSGFILNLDSEGKLELADYLLKVFWIFKNKLSCFICLICCVLSHEQR